MTFIYVLMLSSHRNPAAFAITSFIARFDFTSFFGLSSDFAAVLNIKESMLIISFLSNIVLLLYTYLLL